MQANATSVRISVFSGLVVPRYANLKYGEVNGRSGPGLNYPVVWTYQRRGLPVVVIRESPQWRKIRDSNGDESWVHKRMVTSANNVLAQAQTTIRVEADPSARAVAIIHPGVVVALIGCEMQWCMVVAQDYRGWVHRTDLWGVESTEDTSSGVSGLSRDSERD